MKKQTSTRRVLNISKPTMDIIKTYCSKNTLSLTEWTDRVLLEAVSIRKAAEDIPSVSICNHSSSNHFILHMLYYSKIDREQMLKNIIADFITSGNSYFEVKFGTDNGVFSVTHIPLENKIIRVENSDPINKSYVKFVNKDGRTYENFEILHFRLLTNSENLPYGTPFNMEKFNDNTQSSQCVIRNNRTIERISKMIAGGFEKLGIMELHANSIRGNNLTDFKIKINEEHLKILIENYYLKNIK